MFLERSDEGLVVNVPAVDLLQQRSGFLEIRRAPAQWPKQSLSLLMADARMVQIN